MNDEIKEIIEYKINFLTKSLNIGIPTKNRRYFNDIKDYITNLQQENERLKAKYDNNKSHEINYKYFTTLYSKATKDIVIDDLVYKCEDLDNLKQSYEKLYIEKEDYKSRCEKAIEYINVSIEEGNYFEDDIATDISEPTYDKYVNSNSLLNILQNGSEKDG